MEAISDNFMPWETLAARIFLLTIFVAGNNNASMVVLSKGAEMLSYPADFVQSKEYNGFKTIPSRVHN